MSNRLRVLIYSHAFAPKIGGVETLILTLAKGLAGWKQADGAVSPEITVVTRTPRGTFDDQSLPFPVVRRPSWRKLAELIQGADVIHLGGPAFLPILLGLVMRKQVVVEHSAYQAICPNGLLLDERSKTACPGHFVARRYGECLRCNAANVGRVKSLTMLLLTFPRWWMCGKVARNIVPTRHVGQRVDLPRTATIYHGVPQARGPQTSVAAKSPSPVNFAYVGRFVSEKGLDLLVEAARRLQTAGCNFQLKLVGDGPDRTRLEVAVDAMGLRSRVAFTGYLRGSDLEKALQDIDVVVMPSIWEESAGLSAMEHMMRGRMVIATDIGGLGELVDGTGLKFPLGDIDALTSCMKQVIDDPNLAKVLGEKAGKRAQESFGEERMLAEHLALYRAVAAGHLRTT